MKKIFSIFSLFLVIATLSFAEAKITLNPEFAKKNYNQEITIQPMDKTVTIQKNKITINPKEEGLTYTISGYFNGQIISRTKNTVLKLNNAYLENTSGNAAIFCEVKTEISSTKDTENYIISSGKNQEKAAALQGWKDINLGGSGSLYIIGNVYHGFKADDVKIKGSGKLYLQGTEKGAALNCHSLTVEKDKTFNAYFINSKNGIKADGTILINSGNFYFYNNETALKTDLIREAPKEKHGITLAGGRIYTYQNQNFYITDKKNYKLDGSQLIEE